MSPRLLILALIALAAAAGIIWYVRSDRIYALPSTPVQAGHAVDHARPDPPVTRPRIRRMTREQRDKFAAQIAHSTAAHDQHGSGSATPRKPPQAAHLSTDPAVRKFNDRALEELGGALPYIKECFAKHRAQLGPEVTVLTNVLIVTDPDLGAVVSADALTDPDGKPLPAELDDCIRNMLQTFALPPLPPTDDNEFLLALQLSFRDDD